MWSSQNDYSATGLGLMRFESSNGGIINAIDMQDYINGQYKGMYYITFTAPEGTKYVVFNTQLTYFDNRERTIVVEGADISTNYFEKSTITNLFGLGVSDSELRRSIKVKGNLYDYSKHFQKDVFVNGEGIYRAAEDAGYAKIPVQPNKTYSLWRPHNSYSADTGLLVFEDINGEIIEGLDQSQYINGHYNGSDYITFTTTSATAFIASTIKALAFDNSESFIVVEGTRVDESSKKKIITEIDGLSVSTYKEDYEGYNVTFLGDSLTEFNFRATKFYHQYVAEDLGITVTNMGRSGTGYKQRDTDGNAFYQRVLNTPTTSDAVIFFGSFNDLSAGVPLGSKDDTGTNTLAGAINTTINNLYSILPTVPLGIVSPTPWQASVLSDPENSYTKYAQLLKDICKDRGIPFLDLYRSSGLRPWNANYRTRMYSRDDGNGTHPDENGHKLFYPQFREFVKLLI